MILIQFKIKPAVSIDFNSTLPPEKSIAFCGVLIGNILGQEASWQNGMSRIIGEIPRPIATASMIGPTAERTCRARHEAPAYVRVFLGLALKRNRFDLIY